MRRLLMSALFISAISSSALAQENGTPATTDVTIKRPDGVLLKATYYPAAKPGPGLVLLHACNRDRKSWAPLAKEAAARGFHSIALDYRGFGESQGDPFEPGQAQQAIINEKWPGDVDAAFDYLKSRPGVDGDRIAAAGASCGVNQSVLLARRHPEVKTVVLLSGGVNPQGREFLSRSDWMPVLGSAAHDDGNAVESLQWVMGWSSNPKNKFLEYQNGGHGTDMFAVQKELVPTILTWFEANLRNAPAKPVATNGPSVSTPIQKFWAALEAPDGTAKARKIWEDTRRSNPKLVLFPEGEMNLYGYQLLQEGRTEDAIGVFSLNVEAYPASANVYDSLSDAHLAAGNRAEALRFAEKTLKVLETDTDVPEPFRTSIKESAEKKIRELKAGKTD
jgi:dienelactone hydrolase